ncbi:MAG: hypothetical protein ACFFBP_16605 [Promethearchaeota archaeon]
MPVDNKYQDTELTYYSEIIDFFESKETDPQQIEIWRSKQLIKLMDDLKNNRQSKQVIINSIIIINALLEEIPPDTLNSQGESIEHLTLDEKNIIRHELERELLVI